MFSLPVCCVPMPSSGVPATFMCYAGCSAHNRLDFYIDCVLCFLCSVRHVVYIVVLHSARMGLTVCWVVLTVCWVDLTVCSEDACVSVGWYLACSPVWRCSSTLCMVAVLLDPCVVPSCPLPCSMCCHRSIVWLSSVACVLLHCILHSCVFIANNALFSSG